MSIISEISGDGDSQLPLAWTTACTGNGVSLPPAKSNYLYSVRESTAKFIGSARQTAVAISPDGAKNYVDHFDMKKFE
ncbi:hypothetical protein GGH17_005609, partial [Coemansia sp. RSA 788]